MAQQTFTYKSQSELILAMSGNELYGYTPAEKYDAATFKYPIKVTINKTAKTFTVKEVAEEKEDTKQDTTTTTTPSTSTESSKKTPVYRKAWFWGVIAAVVVVIIIAIVLAVCL